MRTFFGEIARRTAGVLGSASAFVAALAFVVIWIALGPVFGWSSAWQLLINTVTTIVTFLMVFLIQNAENRDTLAMQIKLDELLRAVKDARGGLVDIESLSEEELVELRKRFGEMRQLHAEETKITEEQAAQNVTHSALAAGDD